MTEKDWTKTIAAKLVGRRIVGFSYMTKEEAASQYWPPRPRSRARRWNPAIRIGRRRGKQRRGLVFNE